MLRADYRESIPQAVSGIRDIPSLEGRSKAAIAQAVVLRLLAAAGWDVFDLSQVMPGYITGNRSIDFALMPPGQPRGAVSPRVFIDVRTPGEDVGSPRMERQLLALCAREEVSLAALTNGLRWLLFLWSPGGGQMERRFCEIDLRGDPEAAAADIKRYLTRDRVSSGQAARSAERALRDSNQEAVGRQAIIQGWRQVVGGLDEGLIELVATAAEQRAGHRPATGWSAGCWRRTAPRCWHRAPRTRQGPARARAAASAQYRPPSPWILKRGMSRPGPACWWESA